MVFGDPNSSRDDFNRPRDRVPLREDPPFRRFDERDMRDEMARERELEEMVRADDQRRMDDMAAARFEAAMRELTVDDLREMVNNSNIRVTSGGRISSRRPSGRDIIRTSRQFSRANIMPGMKKPRKKNKKHCKNLSQCFREANKKLRKANGQLRKGKTQADVARMAHRLMKKC